MTAPDSCSWYDATAAAWQPSPPLVGDVTCDVCVVGAGYTGLISALHLAERGFDTVVLEAHRVGWGASGRNGGQLMSGFHPSLAELGQRVGRDDARRLWSLAEEAKAIVRARIARHEIACDLRDGHLSVAVRPRQLDELRRWQDEVAAQGYDRLRLIDRTELRAMVDSPRYLGGLCDAGGGHLHALDYCRGLGRAARQAGVRLFEGSRVERVDTGALPAAYTDRGSVRARWLVLAGNAYLGNTVPALAGWVMPVATDIIATAPLGEARLRALIPSGMAVADCNFVLDYFRPTQDHRLLFGGGASYSGQDRRHLAQALRKKLHRCFPQLADVAIDYCWSGDVAITLDRAPRLGRLGPATLFAHGYSGQGVALTAIAGRVIAEAIAGTAERFDIFARIPHYRFPGGAALRRPLLTLAMTWVRLRDLL
ncbi:MAG: FAD-dependent oxidoreductase [Azospirillum sp.]|nr:FAD-dependent oxidoreductase [Azospirillum sp.]